jgi:molybdate-binding protein
MAAVAATSSSAGSLAALAAGRLHAAVVHGPITKRQRSPQGLQVDRFRLARWRVGLAGPADAPADWPQKALSGDVPVVQREQGAGVQRTFEEAAGDAVPGPRVSTHLEAARRAALTGMPAVTIEPAALAVGAVFHPLDVHEAQMWVSQEWLADRVVGEALTVITSLRFQRRLMAVGGYDLTGCGTRVA